MAKHKRKHIDEEFPINSGVSKEIKDLVVEEYGGTKVLPEITVYPGNIRAAQLNAKYKNTDRHPTYIADSKNEYPILTYENKFPNDKPLEIVSPEFDVLSGGITGTDVIKRALPYATSRLYSKNPFINLYATVARRYNLPDKARLPYFIRKRKDPLILDGSNVKLSGNRWNHINMTIDRPVVSHKSVWDLDDTYLISPEGINLHDLRSIEPSDVFTKEGLPIYTNKNNIGVIITGDPATINKARSVGIKTRSTKKLQQLKANAYKSNEHNKKAANIVQQIQSRYGRPKIKDIKLLEEKTGLKSYTGNINTLDKYRRFEQRRATGHLMPEEVPTRPLYPNNRPMSYTKPNYGINDSYSNFVYDPTSNAEVNFDFNLDKYNDDYFPFLTTDPRMKNGGSIRCSLQNGGSSNKITDEEYYKILEYVAATHYKDWYFNNEDEALLHALNDHTYDYRGYYNENKNGKGNPKDHWPDTYKTALHPTFSTQSKYSGRKSKYNPLGLTGGTWFNDTFIPQAWQLLRPSLKSGGSIYIKPSYRGRLTELKSRTRKSETEPYNDGNSAHKKMVVFARHARKWKH